MVSIGFIQDSVLFTVPDDLTNTQCLLHNFWWSYIKQVFKLGLICLGNNREHNQGHSHVIPGIQGLYFLASSVNWEEFSLHPSRNSDLQHAWVNDSVSFYVLLHNQEFKLVIRNSAFLHISQKHTLVLCVSVYIFILCRLLLAVWAYWPPASPSALSGIWWWCRWVSPSQPWAPAAASCSPSPSCAPQCHCFGELLAATPSCSSLQPACWQPRSRMEKYIFKRDLFIFDIDSLNTQGRLQNHQCKDRFFLYLCQIHKFNTSL